MDLEWIRDDISLRQRIITPCTVYNQIEPANKPCKSYDSALLLPENGW